MMCSCRAVEYDNVIRNCGTYDDVQRGASKDGYRSSERKGENVIVRKSRACCACITNGDWHINKLSMMLATQSQIRLVVDVEQLD